MVKTGQWIKLGAFLVATVAVLATLLAAFGGIRLWQRVDTYYVMVPGSITGLDRGSTVELLGIRVGTVMRFEAAPDHFAGVRVTLELKKGTHIETAARAYLKYRGVTGLKIVDIEQGSSSGPALPPGSTIPYAATTIEKLSAQVEEFASGTRQMITQTTELVGRLNRLAAGLDASRIDDALAHADEAAIGFGVAATELTQTLGEARQSMRGLVARTDRAFAGVDEVFSSGTRTLQQLDRTTAEVGSLVRRSDSEVRSAVRNLRDASQSFKELGRELRLHPSSLLFSSPPPERKLP